MSAANVALAHRGFEAIARGDLDAIGDLLDPGVRWHGGDPDADGACQNRDDALAVMRVVHVHTGQSAGQGSLDTDIVTDAVGG